jgi:hypothetical protein
MTKEQEDELMDDIEQIRDGKLWIKKFVQFQQGTEQPAQSYAPTGEQWTADTVFNLLMSQEDDQLAHEAVADAHNAALAAEREKSTRFGV